MPGVTKEQVQKAREADLFSYLQIYEPGVLKRDGPNYRHREHDSLVYVTGQNYWYWNSRGKSINAITYLMEVRGYDFVGAVERLVGNAPVQAYQPKPVRTVPKEEPPKELKIRNHLRVQKQGQFIIAFVHGFYQPHSSFHRKIFMQTALPYQVSILYRAE